MVGGPQSKRNPKLTRAGRNDTHTALFSLEMCIEIVLNRGKLQLIVHMINFRELNEETHTIRCWEL